MLGMRCVDLSTVEQAGRAETEQGFARAMGGLECKGFICQESAIFVASPESSGF